MSIKRFTVSLDDQVVKEARENLEIGQHLSPVINNLLIEWTIEKKEIKENGK